MNDKYLTENTGGGFGGVMVVREKLGLVEFDVIWTQIKQRGMCLNISTSQALELKLEDCGGQHPRSILCRSTSIWQYIARPLGCTPPHRHVYRSLFRIYSPE